MFWEQRFNVTGAELAGDGWWWGEVRTEEDEAGSEKS